jgi:hypothetical protein
MDSNINKSTPQQDISARQQYPTPIMACDEVLASHSLDMQSADVMQDQCDE